jgi:type IV secretory pathway VirB10-like protein
MTGLDSHGNAGLRDTVDRHYLRIVGLRFSRACSPPRLRSRSEAAKAPSRTRRPAQTAGSAVGQELSQTAAQITRRNLNVQPTIKVPAGYRFTVRVNRDILFDAPYEPVQPQIEHIPANGAQPRGKN